MSDIETDQMLDELLDDDSDSMTAWETEFIDSVNRQRAHFGEDWLPSDRQEGVIVEVWHRVFG